ncbi:OLC1v1026807C1 [Oldenlandia corymbosa var. corymbosa]|uniref:OLC1v1026807C1 n=1 Tax=Oldenlandia corymbosa var. corymbosa TaxID=529605 RepID=A0AAV1C870_OLDCO|nr:OLC1v1026807C1 [Oldenlandia corymbosa var. corymbosa]
MRKHLFSCITCSCYLNYCYNKVLSFSHLKRDYIRFMGKLVHFQVIYLFHYLVIFSAFLKQTQSFCTAQNRLLLFQFKQSINVHNTASSGCESNGIPSYPTTEFWNTSSDCCTWDGVTCDQVSGEVIGLDLSCSQLQGKMGSNSSIFKLSSLQSLNLAYNDFSSSGISRNFSRLGSLRHLNLSSSGFSGSLPSDFLSMFNLVSLDLSLSDGLTIQPRTFKMLLQNSTRLREVLLTGVNIPSVIPHNLSNSLTILNLGGTNLYGNCPEEIFTLPNLQILQLYSNYDLTGHLWKVKWNASSQLSYIDISSSGFSGEIPESIGYLHSLNYLEISSCKFSGSIPESLGNLTQMTHLDLNSNNFSGKVPSSLSNLQQLTFLDLSTNSLEGRLPDFFSNFRNLAYLMLNDNLFTGEFPSSITNLTELTSLDLSNSSLTGPLPSDISGFPNLALLFLKDNSFNGILPPWIFSLPSLKFLDLQSNELTGHLYEFQYQSIQRIYLSGNKLHGPIPKSISKLVNLTYLDLSSNLFSGPVDVSLFSKLQPLQFLSLSNNSLVLTRDRMNATFPDSLTSLYLSSCGLKDIEPLAAASNLYRLDVSRNMIRGRAFSDKIWYMWAETLISLDISHNFLTQMNQLPFTNLFFLDLSHNLFQGSMLIPPITTRLFFASNNNFSGKIHPSVCKLSILMVLDISENNFSGAIPECLANVSEGLYVLDMHSNRFSGRIPSNFAVGSNLRTLKLHNNQLEGSLPRSLSRCRELEVLDVGYNNLNGTFPTWLGTLPKLKVLSLRANNMHGPVNSSRAPDSFSTLRILDLSNNAFAGILPEKMFQKLGAMKREDETSQPLTYIGDETYQDSVKVIIKGLDINFERILSIFTTMDFSINNFTGKIPDAIGDLVALRGLNLSHNDLSGPIPQVLGNLKVLESLDLSLNQLQGQIPQQLTNLPYLSAFNVSYNHLQGSIPRGQQFNTFENSSYLGNPGLCGFPLSNTCGANDQLPKSRPRVEEDEEFFNGFTWKAVMIGYGCGMVIGFLIGCLIFITGKPEWFNEFVQEESSRFVKKKWSKQAKVL